MAMWPIPCFVFSYPSYSLIIPTLCPLGLSLNDHCISSSSCPYPQAPRERTERVSPLSSRHTHAHTPARLLSLIPADPAQIGMVWIWASVERGGTCLVSDQKMHRPSSENTWMIGSDKDPREMVVHHTYLPIFPFRSLFFSSLTHSFFLYFFFVFQPAYVYDNISCMTQFVHYYAVAFPIPAARHF